ncbi:MAG: HAD family phosphatase [Clostridia bacterium]|nr:HAD family phosphatase [Clostridia bacterium]
MKKVFFIDIDGTILDSKTEVSDYNIEALNSARKAGHKVFINTGRGKACIPKPILDLPLDGIVSGCGCTVTVDGADVYSDCPPLDDIIRYAEGVFKKGQHCFLEGENYLFRINCSPEDETDDPFFAEYIRTARLDYGIWHPLRSAEDLRDYPDARIPKFNLVGSFDISEVDGYREHFDGVVDNCKCEMYSKGNSKATGLDYVMKNHFPGYISVAIGDSENDREMLAAADVSVAMGNANDGIKALCTVVTDTCDNDGMGKAVLKLMKE